MPQKIRRDPLSLSGKDKKLSIKDLIPTAVVNVTPYEGEEIIVTVEGSAEAIDVFSILEFRDEVVLVGKVQDIRKQFPDMSELEFSLMVQVPVQNDLEIYGDYQELQIGDVKGTVSVYSLSKCETFIGYVGSLTLAPNDSGDIFVKGVQGHLAISHSATGNIRIESGQVNRANINLFGKGEITANITAKVVYITHTGIGNIHIQWVEKKPFVEQTGIGKIQFGNWELG